MAFTCSTIQLTFGFVLHFSAARSTGNEISADTSDDPWNYDLEQVTTKFNGGKNENPHVILTYLMHKDRKPLSGDNDEEMDVLIFQNGCRGEQIDKGEIWVQEKRVSNTMRKDVNPEMAWDVILSMNTQKVRANTNLWSGNEWDFILELCVRTTMKKFDDNVWKEISFDETNINVDIELTSKFEIAKIGARTDKIQSKDEKAEITYAATACVCDAGENCLNPPPAHHPNEQLKVCVTTGDSTVEIFAIEEFKLLQNNDMITKAVDDRISDAVTTVTIKKKDNRRMAVVSTPLLKEFFFHKDAPGDIKVEGIAYMAFPRNRRALRTGETDIEVAGKGEFDLRVPFVAETGAGAVVASSFAFVAVSLIMVLA